MRKITHYLNFLLPALFLYSCAQVGNPSGGEIDTEPPQIVSSYPENFSTQFNDSEFEIIFDEYVQLKDVSTNLLVSPPLKSPPVVSLRGRKIIVTWEDTLRANTTYAFNFGPSVVDLNEGNPYPELVYVFSTGNFIDSLQFAGNVIDVYTMTPAANTKVLLYDNFQDSLPLTTPPNYFGRTNAEGNFNISYMKEGNYKVFALQEELSNYIYNGPPEKMAFSDSIISPLILDSNSVPFQMYLFEETDTAQFIVESKFYDYGYMQLVMNTAIDSLNMLIRDAETDASINYLSLINKGRDSINIWLNEPFEGEELEVILKRSENHSDTLLWYFETAERFREVATFEMSNNISGGAVDQLSPVKFTFNAPLVAVDSGRIKLMEDSLPVNPSYRVAGEGNKNFIIDYNFAMDKSYQLFIPDSVFVNLYGLGNDTIQNTFRLRPTDFYGKLIVNLKLPEFEGDYILQLTNDKGAVLKEFYDVKSGETVINLVKPASYGLKVVFDENENRKWDTGNYSLHQQPESIEVYKEIFQVRANWDLQIDWNIKGKFTLPETDPNPSTPEISP